jgi:hypothetical protein
MDGNDQDQRPRRKGRKRSAAVLVVLAAVLVAAVLVAVYLWRQVGDVAIGTGGLIVLGVGGAVTLALGGVLIALMVLSDRRGYDKGLGRE